LRISTKLKIFSLVPAFTALAIGTSLLVSFDSLRTLEEQNRTANRISDEIGEMEILVRSYLLYNEERPRQQFLRMHGDTTRLIVSAGFDSRYQQLLKDVAADVETVKALFLKLVSINDGKGSPLDASLHLEAEERIAGQLFIRSRNAKKKASLLLTQVSDEVVAGQKRLNTIVLSLMIGASLLFTFVLLGLTRNITSSLAKIREGAEILGSGNLSHRIGLSSDDEIGVLSQAFDLMSGKLAATTVSRDKLAVELETIFSSMHLCVAYLDPRFRFLRVNRAYAEAFGHPPGFFIGKNLFDLFPHEETEAIFRGVVETGQPFTAYAKSFVFPAPSERGVTYWDWTLQPVYGLDGCVEGLLFSLVDVTERKRAELERKADEQRFRALMEDLPVGIFIVQDGRIVFRNHEQERLFGSLPDDFEFRNHPDIHPDDTGKFAQLSEAVCSGGDRTLELDLRFFPYGGSAAGIGMRWAHVRTIPIVHLGGHAALVTMVDVTKTKELEHFVRVREKMASLGHVAAGIAHEIRNPLSGINIYVSTMEQVCLNSEDLEPERREKILDIIEQLKSASSRIASVIQKVMDFSKPGSPLMSRVDLNDAIEEATALSGVTLRKKGIAFSKTLCPDLPLCMADIRLMEQVVLNLINNAAQAMDGISGPKKLDVRSSVHNKQIVIRISDSGPGIPLPLRDKIFDPFFTTRKEGYGIGLSFCHRVVADHGGTLAVGTGEWGGAEFRIAIPVVRKGTEE
jgi:PAS domain S-box-containing protein